MLHLSDQQTGDIGRQSRELFEIFTHFHSESRFWVGNWTNLAKYDQRANSTGHIKVWFMRSLPGSCAGSGYTAATGCGKIELSSGRNFRVGLFSERDLVHRGRLSDDCGGVLNSLTQQWERIKRFGLSSFGQFFCLLRWSTHRFCRLGCKCPNTGNALSAV